MWNTAGSRAWKPKQDHGWRQDKQTKRNSKNVKRLHPVWCKVSRVSRLAGLWTLSPMENTFKVSTCIKSECKNYKCSTECLWDIPLLPSSAPSPTRVISHNDAHLTTDTGRRYNTNSQHKTGQSKALPMAPSSHHIPQPQHWGHGSRMLAPWSTNDLPCLSEETTTTSKGWVGGC